jgi:hypothetical protein
MVVDEKSGIWGIRDVLAKGERAWTLDFVENFADEALDSLNAGHYTSRE